MSWSKKEGVSDHGIYFLRSSKNGLNEKEIWNIYNTIREIESTFRCLKTDLSIRPVFHQKDINTEAHIHLGILAYHLVSIIRYRLKAKGHHHDWTKIIEIMKSQSIITTSMISQRNTKIHIRICSLPNIPAAEIYQALKLVPVPFYRRKSVVPKK